MIFRLCIWSLVDYLDSLIEVSTESCLMGEVNDAVSWWTISEFQSISAENHSSMHQVYLKETIPSLIILQRMNL